MGKKVTVCPVCKKAGYWRGVSGTDPVKIKHVYCGSVFNMDDWIHSFKMRQDRSSDWPESWDEEERQRFIANLKNPQS